MTIYTNKISIADITLALDCNHEPLAQQLIRHYAPFGSDAPATLDVQIEWRPPSPNAADADGYEFTFEQGRLLFSSARYQGEIDVAARRAWLQLQSANPMVGVEYFIRAVYALLLLDAGGLLLHSAGLVHHERAYLFFGHSGSGKSTVVSLSQNAIVLSDDLVALRPVGESWCAYATPFWNPTRVIPSPYSAPVAGLYRLVQDQRVWLETVSPAQAVAELTSSVPVVSADPERGALVVARCLQLASQVGLKRLHFRKDDTFWKVVMDMDSSERF